MDVPKSLPFANNRRMLTTSTILIVILLEFTATQTTGPGNTYRQFDSETYESKEPERGDWRQRPAYFAIFYVLGAIYAFAGLVLTCKYFFVPSLEVIVENSGIEDDVAGATFMAIGLSLNTILLGWVQVFVSSDDESPLDSVTGTSLFNILFVVGLCVVAGKGFVQLTCWPLIRDCVFFLIGFVWLVLISRDESITWYEALLMIGIFAIYILLMKFDHGLRSLSDRLCCNNTAPSSALTSEVTHLVASCESGGKPTPVSEENPGREVKVQGLTLGWPEGNPVKAAAHVIFFPVSLLLYCTLPDVSTARGRRFYPWAYFGSILWATVLSDVIVWAASPNAHGDVRTLSEFGVFFTTGLAGSPILITSLFLARKGKGAMIVHAGFGSAIFVICIRTMQPALIYSIFFGEHLRITSRNASCQAGMLFVMLCLFVLTLICFRRNMTRGFGILVLIYFILFTSGALLINFGFFSCF